jgi:hypothetical protein
MQIPSIIGGAAAAINPPSLKISIISLQSHCTMSSFILDGGFHVELVRRKVVSRSGLDVWWPAKVLITVRLFPLLLLTMVLQDKGRDAPSMIHLVAWSHPSGTWNASACTKGKSNLLSSW